MTEESKPKVEKIEDLELNRETVQDLSETESEKVEGGLAGRPVPCMSCNDSCSPSNWRP